MDRYAIGKVVRCVVNQFAELRFKNKNFIEKLWDTLEKLATNALAYSTPLGMAWFFILFIFRMFVVTVVGGAVYGDEAVSPNWSVNHAE